MDIKVVLDTCLREIDAYSEEKKEQLRKAYDNMLPDEAYLPPDGLVLGSDFGCSREFSIEVVKVELDYKLKMDNVFWGDVSDLGQAA